MRGVRRFQGLFGHATKDRIVAYRPLGGRRLLQCKRLTSASYKRPDRLNSYREPDGIEYMLSSGR